MREGRWTPPPVPVSLPATPAPSSSPAVPLVGDYPAAVDPARAVVLGGCGRWWQTPAVPAGCRSCACSRVQLVAWDEEPAGDELGALTDPDGQAGPITDAGGYLECGCHGSQREHTCAREPRHDEV